MLSSMYFVHIFAYVLYSSKEKLKTRVGSDSKSVHMKKKKKKCGDVFRKVPKLTHSKSRQLNVIHR